MVSFKYQGLAIRKRVCGGKKKSFFFLSLLWKAPLGPCCHPLSSLSPHVLWPVQRQIWQPRRRHCDCSYGDGGPQDLGKTLPIVRPGGGKHGKCESLPRSISPGLCQVYLPPSLSSQSLIFETYHLLREKDWGLNRSQNNVDVCSRGTYPGTQGLIYRICRKTFRKIITHHGYLS